MPGGLGAEVISRTCRRRPAVPARGGRRRSTAPRISHVADADALPDFALAAGVRVVCGFSGLIEPWHRREAAFKRLDYLADSDGRGVAKELVATSGPADGADEPGLAKGGQKLVEVLFRDVAAKGDFGRLQRSTTVVSGEFDEGAKAVVAASGDAHGVRGSRCVGFAAGFARFLPIKSSKSVNNSSLWREAGARKDDLEDVDGRATLVA